jgi:hypothetical protein
VIAAGVSLTLLSFGAAIGLSVMSTAPTWRDSSPWLWLVSGLFLLFVSVAAFGFGGYSAGRLRGSAAVPLSAEEIEFSDGMHGIVTWALTILLTAVLGLAGAALTTPLAAPGGHTTGPASSVAGETIIATELDDLLRTDSRTFNADTMAYRRAEAARILLKSSSHSGVTSDERAALSRLVSSATGVSADEADARTQIAIDQSALEIRRAREAAVLQAFFVAASLLLGAAVAWFAASEGGREREVNRVPRWDWSFRRRVIP